MTGSPLLGAAFLSCLLAVGCADLPRLSGPPSSRFDRRCIPHSTELRAVSLSELSGPSTRREAPPIEQAPTTLSPRSMEIAEIIDALPLISYIATRQGTPGTLEGEVALLKAKQQLLGRILLANLEVSSTAAEAGCEQERADWIADRLEEAQASRVKYHTLAGVIFGGLANILAGGLALAAGETAAGEIASIVGGAFGTLFGASALFQETEQAFRHPRNLLREIWEGPNDTKIFPRSVWRYLNRTRTGPGTGQTLRQEIIARWQDERRLGPAGSDLQARRAALLFGDGGIYEIQDFRARAAMLETLQASINLMHEDLEQLIREVLIQEAIVE
ncbi:hypothetical protein [Candidatus Nitrospira bockiana]